jgi:hypothetical protein
MTREEMLSRARKELWAGWVLSSDEIGSAAANTLLNVGMLVEPGGAQELERLRARVAELEAQREALATRLRAGQEWQPGRSPALVTQDYVSQDELRSIFGIALTAPWDAARADGITVRIAPTQALQLEDPHDSPLHRSYRTGRDLPKPGGAQ